MSEQELADIWRDLDKSVDHLRKYVLEGDRESCRALLAQIEQMARVGLIELEVKRRNDAE